MAVITCVPDVVEEKVYAADPPDRARDDVSVVPSTTMVRVPVGVPVMELDAGATMMVMTSFAPEDGELLAAESVVVVASSEAVEPEGHAVSRL